MEFGILGPLEVSDGDRLLRLSGARQKALLALLLLHANEVVSSDRLIDELWGEEPPEKAANALQARVSQLRKALGRSGSEALVTRAPGYPLEVGPGELDVERFVRLAGEGRQALAQGDAAGAAATLGAALALWRGPALADFTYEPFGQGEIARLEEARLAALEERLEADLALGRHGELAGELEALVAAHPLRERLRGQLMLALYRSGRQAEALEAYQETRRVLVEELGIEPSPPLRELHAAILNQDAGLERTAEPKPPRAEPSAPTLPVTLGPAREVRKTVTVLVSDRGRLLGQAPDPEAHRRAAELHLETVSPGLERHGGAVHGLHGQQVLAVFGIPLAHEDDALRAVRAAVELGDASAIGVATGEVLAGEAVSGQAVVTGEAVGVAARLAQAAATGEILIDEATRRLVRDAVHVDPADVAPDGSVWRLCELETGAPAFVRHFETPLVGRERELAQVLQSFARAVEERTSCLFTLFGPAGIGKSRLAQELAAALAEEATVLARPA